MKTGFTLGGIAVEPGLHALARDPHRFGDVGLRPPGPTSLDDEQPAAKRSAGISVGHENLRWEWAFDKPHPIRRFSFVQAGTPATNVLAEYI